MKTPICDFVEKYASENVMRLHMPGHKGQGELQKRDITEIEGADVLYHAQGIIAQSQQNATRLFDTGKTVYSCEGSSLSVRAMLYLARLWAAQRGIAPKILAGRNAHKSFVSAAGMLDMEICWLYSESLLSCQITPETLSAALQAEDEPPAAVYVTSPDYLGNQADIAALSAVCRRENVLLLVDNAHGAYLHFLPQSTHPIALGAHLCCDSAHKTLPVLTGGGYLHIAKHAPAVLFEQAENAMALFASTSPSYLILQSLDKANAYLEGGYREKLAAFIKEIAILRQRLTAHGFDLVGTEPLKLTLAPKSMGYRGEELAEMLLKRAIVSEFADADFVVLMLSPEQEECLLQLEQALLSIEKRPAVTEKPPLMPHPKRKLSPREAMFCPSVLLPVRECEGRVLGALSVSCPPAVPIAVCGEVIDQAVIKVMQYYGISECYVI